MSIVCRACYTQNDKDICVNCKCQFCYKTTFIKCKSCNKSCCSFCIETCNVCNNTRICETCLNLHKEETCDACKEFGFINKTCRCVLHKDVCIVCLEGYGKTINTTIKCIYYRNCGYKKDVNLCKKHFELEDLTSRKELDDSMHSSYLCSFCSSLVCSECRNIKKERLKCIKYKTLSLLICSCCSEVNSILKEKFSELERCILLEYLYNIY